MRLLESANITILQDPVWTRSLKDYPGLKNGGYQLLKDDLAILGKLRLKRVTVVVDNSRDWTHAFLHKHRFEGSTESLSEARLLVVTIQREWAQRSEGGYHGAKGSSGVRKYLWKLKAILEYLGKSEDVFLMRISENMVIRGLCYPKSCIHH